MYSLITEHPGLGAGPAAKCATKFSFHLEENMNLEELRFNAYHCIPAGPHERRTTELVRSDIVSHLPIIEYYASLCEHCTEFGVRDANSTIAMLTGCPGKVVSYDINDSLTCRRLRELPEVAGRFEFHLRSTVDVSLNIEETDLLFLDTLHTYDHLRKELLLHSHRVRKFFIFHDTFTCGQRDISGPNPDARGIIPAIEEWLKESPCETVFRTDRCNGLWVLKRV